MLHKIDLRVVIFLHSIKSITILIANLIYGVIN